MIAYYLVTILLSRFILLLEDIHSAHEIEKVQGMLLYMSLHVFFYLAKQGLT